MSNGANLTPRQVIESANWKRFTLDEKVDTIAEFLISGYGLCSQRSISCKAEFVSKKTFMWIGILFFVGSICFGIGVGIITWREALSLAAKGML